MKNEYNRKATVKQLCTKYVQTQNMYCVQIQNMYHVKDNRKQGYSNGVPLNSATKLCNQLSATSGTLPLCKCTSEMSQLCCYKDPSSGFVAVTGMLCTLGRQDSDSESTLLVYLRF